MIKLYSRVSKTYSEGHQEESISATREISIGSSVQTIRKIDEVADSKTIDKQPACFFMHSVGTMPSKQSMLIEEILSSERWDGVVIAMEEQTVIADAYQVGHQRCRYRLKIEKAKIQDSESEINRGTELIITSQRIRTYQGNLIKKIVIRVRKPQIFPEEFLARNFEERMARYSYMYRDESKCK